MLPSVVWVHVFTFAHRADFPTIATASRLWNKCLANLWKYYLQRDWRVQKYSVAHDVCVIEGRDFRDVYRELHTNKIKTEEWHTMVMNIDQPYVDAKLIPPESVLRDLVKYEFMAVSLGHTNHLASLAYTYETLFNEGGAECAKTKCGQYLALCASYAHQGMVFDDWNSLSDMFVRTKHPDAWIIIQKGVAAGEFMCFVDAQKLDYDNAQMLELCDVAEAKCDRQYWARIRIQRAKIWEGIHFVKSIDILLQALAETTEQDPNHLAILHCLGVAYEDRHDDVRAEQWYRRGFDLVLSRASGQLTKQELTVCCDLADVLSYQRRPREALQCLNMVRAQRKLSNSCVQELTRVESEVYLVAQDWSMVLATPWLENHIVAYYERKDYARAINVALGITCTQSRSERVIARCYLMMGEPDKARDWLSRYESKIDDEATRAISALEWAHFYAEVDHVKLKAHLTEARRLSRHVSHWTYGFHELLTLMCA